MYHHSDNPNHHSDPLKITQIKMLRCVLCVLDCFCVSSNNQQRRVRSEEETDTEM